MMKSPEMPLNNLPARGPDYNSGEVGGDLELNIQKLMPAHADILFSLDSSSIIEKAVRDQTRGTAHVFVSPHHLMSVLCAHNYYE